MQGVVSPQSDWFRQQLQLVPDPERVEVELFSMHEDAIKATRETIELLGGRLHKGEGNRFYLLSGSYGLAHIVEAALRQGYIRRQIGPSTEMQMIAAELTEKEQLFGVRTTRQVKLPEIGNLNETTHRTVRLQLPRAEYVQEQVRRAVQTEELENRKPIFIFLGMRWWFSIQQAPSLFDLPVYPDHRGERGVRVLCSPGDEENRFLMSKSVGSRE